VFAYLRVSDVRLADTIDEALAISNAEPEDADCSDAEEEGCEVVAYETPGIQVQGAADPSATVAELPAPGGVAS